MKQYEYTVSLPYLAVLHKYFFYDEIYSKQTNVYSPRMFLIYSSKYSVAK